MSIRVAIHAGQLLQKVPGGIGRYVAALLRELPAHDVEPIAFGAGHRPAEIVNNAAWQDIGWPRDGLRYEAWHRLRFPSVRIDADLIHAPSLAVPPKDSRPLIVTVHDVSWLRHPQSTTERGAKFHQRGLELTFRDADLVLCPSEFTRDELLAEGYDGTRIRIARLGCDPAPPADDDVIDAAVTSLGIEGRFLLTVGTVEPRKRLNILVEAFNSLRRSHPDLQLVIVGPTGWGKIGRLDHPGVMQLGRLPWRDVDALYRRAQLCCIPSVYEGFGLPAAEALARGCPTIVTRGNALEEVVGDAGILIDSDDVLGTHDAIERVLEDARLRSDLARRGPPRMASMSWANTAREHAAIYRDLISGRS